ncbi:MAG TPA: hypothetical protein ENG83_06565 [Nitrospirae bacterium]|nr:hypothetical protein BMS3Abin06_01066 [bacterium BMS3Abin06]HDH11843.1 hypothetical protein [Nitrospirota bacterium]HDZ02815.1 hypothetical protein [Nitrospirota bacterium]
MFNVMRMTVVLFLFLLTACGGSQSGGESGDTSATTTSTGGSLTTLEYEDSPFGFHPALVNRFGYSDNGYVDARKIGVRWNRPSLYTFWFKVQPDINDPAYHWEEYDTLYGNVPEGINILANIATQPRSYDAGYEIPGSYLPVDEGKYTAFVKATVERYDGDGIGEEDFNGGVFPNPIKYWQVDNEPNALTKTGYAGLQQITYMAIKEACSDCQVLIGGATGFPDNFADNFSVYAQILSDLNGQYVDIFDFHWYGFADGDYHESKDACDLVRSKLNEYGFGNIPVWITEMGSHSGTITWEDPYNGLYQTEAQQAEDYLKRFIYPLSFGVKKIFPAFGLIEGFKQNNGYFDHTGLLYDGEDPDVGDDKGLGIKKLGYYSYKLMTEKLEGSDWDKIRTIQESGNVHIYKFTKDNNSIYVAWWDYFDEAGYQEGDTKTIAFDIDFTGDALITDAVPNAVSGAVLDENNYPDFFETETKSVTNGQVTITLGENPVFVEAAQ